MSKYIAMDDFHVKRKKKLISFFNVEKVTVYGFMLIATLVTILPFVWMILTSVKTQSEAISVPPQILPDNWQMSAYSKIIEELPFAQFYMNSIIVTFVMVILQTLIAAMAAYGFLGLDFLVVMSYFLFVSLS